MSATMTAIRNQPGAHDTPALSFLWLEVTAKCNLECVHCYADSGPARKRGSITSQRWKGVITEARHLGAQSVQFIGGEPTLHPEFEELVRHAANESLTIEVYTNLLNVTTPMLDMFEALSVSIATSFYSLDEEAHDRVTTRRGSQEKTLRNIRTVLNRRLPLRVGIINIQPDQRIEETEQMLKSIGVTSVGVDHMRRVGRGLQPKDVGQSVDALCGSCGMQNAAIDPDGNVYPCVFARWLKVGNVQEESLARVVEGDGMRKTKEYLRHAFSMRGDQWSGEGVPDITAQGCDPNCNPSCSPNCNPTCHPVCRPGMCHPVCAPY